MNSTAAETLLRELLDVPCRFRMPRCAFAKILRTGLAERRRPDGRLVALSPTDALTRLDVAWDSE